MLGMKACSSCALEIPAAARLCSHCKSYQDWRRFLSVSTTTLALLTALVSTGAASIATITSSAWFADSEVNGRFVLDARPITLSIANTGNRPARIDSISLELPPIQSVLTEGPDLPVFSGIVVEIDDDDIPAGSSRQEPLSISPETARMFAAELRARGIRLAGPGEEDPFACTLKATISNFRGSMTPIESKGSCLILAASLKTVIAEPERQPDPEIPQAPGQSPPTP